MVPYLEIGGFNVFLSKKLWFQCFSVGTEGSNGFLFRNCWFQCFSVQELNVPVVPYLEMDGSKVFLFRN